MTPPAPDGSVAVRIEVAGMPQVLDAIRHRLAEITREFATREDPRVATRLRQIAAAFEEES